MAHTTSSTCAVLNPSEGHALLQAHCAAKPPPDADTDRTPARLPSDRYNHLAHDTGMRRTLHTIPPVVSVTPGSVDEHIRHAFRRHSYPPLPRRASEPLW
ncbi:hypothetical protein FB451DRAFT_1395106 [Mycena latifolia]|nr:hypothetical protein FB451DRAFT_1395106 [Mycena latifolia]